ncbi:putative Aldehyde dehydrogenase [Vibrio nigripulchritudo SFn27]|uniref:Putative Aldehyde dehydrogenase n=1 Tax=Vibrio nigripulchritudo TaxID=28173 RepID=U4KB83_9VIBR|nr:aldehyde dehydrogenase family protein [Vibrio nigripulchritudo]CCN80597.1 putative Aldehyde dehydrogenase [Vibrio nigripulchritudo BLFn1]CCN90590.1 putative Aldehyde dehydrogenase [Vibrio nigripulchritudo SFn27]CCN93473.1 putative Aldehyde dehydrogenase [Vibrio nigripulchritudo ENn2]CCO41863.1 putative Aldehyde dehydrogenase [Vibrio nigripulchritudo SFn135]CCO52025.1 putative Aldehyde dehydrogenase [Vibrio nigripulchritudo Wn13]
MTTSLPYEKALYIGGEWQSGESTIANINPSDISETIGTFAQASEQQTQQAIAAAKTAQKEWEKTPMERKQAVLQAIGDELIARCDELGTLLSREEGKPFAEGRGEIYRAGQFFQYFAAEVLRQIGDTADSVRPGVSVEVTREAVGVVAIISPWNFPTATAAWKIAPALAFGNSVIWKPANLTPASAVALTEIIHRQGLPAGTFNLVLGSGSKVGNTLINSKEIDAVSFTGSVETGRKVAAATAPNFVRCQLEMGSKNALVIADDADIQTAVDATIAGSFSGAGQKCTASSRLVVMDSIHDQYVETLIKRMSELKVGHALDDGIFMGPVVDGNQLEANFAWLEKARTSGAELAFGGERLSLKHEGYYMSPTLFLDTKNQWEVNQEEVFAPMASVIRASDLDEAIAITNDTRFGLTGGIITQSLRTSALFKQQAQTGCVMVNLPTAGTDYHVPFGGRKESSFGPREQGQYAKEFYTVVKTAYQCAY